jgi:cytochrome P450
MQATPIAQPPTLAEVWRTRSATRAVPTLPGLPALGNLLEFRRARLDVFERVGALGPIARFHLGPLPVHVVTDGTLAQEILVDRADDFMKSRGLAVFAQPLLGDGLLTSEGLDHRRARKLLAPAFAAKRIAGYAQVMTAEAAATAAAWKDGAHVDLAEAMMEMTLAIAGKTLFDADVRGDAAVVAEALTIAMKCILDGVSSPLQVPYAWPLPRHQRMKRAVAQLDAIVYRIIDERRRDPRDRGDVLSILVGAVDDDGRAMTDRELRDEVMTLLLAGHETTANLLAWTFYALARHPDVRARVEAEIDGAAPGVAELPYTAMVLDEVMRLWPPVYTVGRQAARDTEIGGVKLPRGAAVMTNIWGIHRRPDLYPDPLRFEPARMAPDAKKARGKLAFLPFGAGPRVCIGNHFALMEAQLALAAIMRTTRIELASSKEAEPEPMITLRPRGGLPVVVHARRRSAGQRSPEVAAERERGGGGAAG